MEESCKNCRFYEEETGRCPLVFWCDGTQVQMGPVEEDNHCSLWEAK